MAMLVITRGYLHVLFGGLASANTNSLQIPGWIHPGLTQCQPQLVNSVDKRTRGTLWLLSIAMENGP